MSSAAIASLSLRPESTGLSAGLVRLKRWTSEDMAARFVEEDVVDEGEKMGEVDWLWLEAGRWGEKVVETEEMEKRLR